MAIQVYKFPEPLSYADGLRLQQEHGTPLERETDKIAHLLLLQHKPVYTLGRKTARRDLLCSNAELAARTGAEVFETDRGGSVTYHAPGQLTAYLLLNLRVWELPIHAHLDKLEQAVIGTLARFGIAGRREAGMTGVWVGNNSAELKVLSAASPSAPQHSALSTSKICAIGVSARKWVTYHGLSLNVDLDVQAFYEVVPCGLQGKSVTSMARVLGRPVDVREVEAALAAVCGEVYGAEVESRLSPC